MSVFQPLPQLLNQEEFKSWLLTKNKNRSVGARIATDCCPIANWLKESYGLSAQVHNQMIVANSETIETPAWIKYFVRQVTLKSSYFTFCDAGEALSILQFFRSEESENKESQEAFD